MKSIVIFNGWGMDERILEGLEIPKNYDVKVLNFPYKLDQIDRMDNIIWIGWSFGAYYLAKFLLENGIKSDKAIAINGHSQTIGRYGINPKMFDLTIDTLTSENLLKFYKNMEISENFRLPDREFEEVKSELIYFRENYIEDLENIFRLAVIGSRDKIIPASKQRKYFKKENGKTKIIEMDFGHYPFNDKEILKKIMEELL